MKNKLIITESQYERLRLKLNEGVHSNLVKEIKNELDKNYEPVEKYVREGGEYSDTPMIRIKADGEEITPKSLYEYLKYKYKANEEFTKQVVRDWMYGTISDDYRLTKNIAL